MSKIAVIQRLIARLEADHAALEAAAAGSKENATGDEAKSEGKYDTRAIEASYLAGAQAEQAALALEALHLMRSFDPPDYNDGEAIGPGALVETEHNGEIVFYLLAPAGGGLTIDHDGFELTVLSPEARIYQSLLGRRVGEIDFEAALCILAVD